MMDNGIPAKISAPEPSSYSSASGAASKGDGKGFSETLNTVGQQSQKPASGEQSTAPADAADETIADGAATGAETALAGTAADRKAPRSTRPMIDIRYRGPLSLPKEQADIQLPAGTGKANKAEAEQALLKLKAGQDDQAAEVIDDTSIAVAIAKAVGGQQKAGAPAETDKVADEMPAGEAAEDPLDEMLTLLAAGAAQTTTADDGKTRTKSTDAAEPNAVGARKDLAGGLAAGLKSVADDHADTALPEGTTDAADQAFRLVRADGKGQAMSIRGGEQAGEAQADPASAAKDSGPTVTILDARRFLAPVSDTNAANISAAFLGDSSWVEAMRAGSIDSIDSLTANAGKVVNTLKIQMTPIELGLVTAAMRLSGETLSIQLTVESPAAMHKLKEDSNDIMSALKAQGFAVDQIQITVAASSRSDTDTGSPQQQSGGGQQTAQGGGQGGQAQRQQAGSPVFDDKNAVGMNTDEAAATQRSQGDTGGTRPSHVYI